MILLFSQGSFISPLFVDVKMRLLQQASEADSINSHQSDGDSVSAETSLSAHNHLLLMSKGV